MLDAARPQRAARATREAVHPAEMIETGETLWAIALVGAAACAYIAAELGPSVAGPTALTLAGAAWLRWRADACAAPLGAGACSDSARLAAGLVEVCAGLSYHLTTTTYYYY